MPPPPTPRPPRTQRGRGSVVKPSRAQADKLPPVATGGLRGVRYGAIILAAGLSSRMVENKVLLPWRDGLPIVRHVAAKFASVCAGNALVVTGRDAAQVRAAVEDLNVTCVHNSDYATGEMLSSVKAGLRVLPAELDGCFIQPADMPLVTQAVIERLLAAQEAGWNVAPRCAGRRGHPVLLDRAYWEAMLDLPPDAKPRDAIEAARERLRLVDVADEGVLLDIDTRAAYERALGVTGDTDRA
ncbi:MAG: nucleotidyltransferase family protein [Chloroflexota bacterium]|nr:nucleotidyltransferase family protein [Chloroflexota bacterium]MDE2908517.1 nucleotidyltransferase family protein [Chloroflexota bacterium]